MIYNGFRLNNNDSVKTESVKKKCNSESVKTQCNVNPNADFVLE